VAVTREAGTIRFAHETWFDHGVYPTDWGFTAEPRTLAFLAAALLLTIAVRLVARSFPGVDVPALGRLAPFMPFAIRLHLAVSTLALLSLGFYGSPATDLKANLTGVLLGAVMAVVAITMATWVARPLGSRAAHRGRAPCHRRIRHLARAAAHRPPRACRLVLATGPGRWRLTWRRGVRSNRRWSITPAPSGRCVSRPASH
jgi:hypothetical protein